MPKFLCGVILEVNGMDYYVPVSSFKGKRPDNFVILSDNNIPVSSLRFNYMFPIPKGLTEIQRIDTEQDIKYKALLSQELRFCIQHQADIIYLAQRTYKRVVNQYSPSLVKNSCDFVFLEEKCRKYCQTHGLQLPVQL